MPEVPEDQAKAMIKQIAKPEAIAGAFDAAKDIVTDIVVTGSRCRPWLPSTCGSGPGERREGIEVGCPWRIAVAAAA